MISTKAIVDADGWKVREITDTGTKNKNIDNPDIRLALIVPINNGTVNIPFDEVRASGGLLELYNNGECVSTFTEAIDGLNKHTGDESSIPKPVFEKLKEIGPY